MTTSHGSPEKSQIFYGQMAFIDRASETIDREKETVKCEMCEMQYEISRPKPMVNQMNSLKCRGEKRKRPKVAEKAKGRRERRKSQT
jgi:hypothetical protein